MLTFSLVFTRMHRHCCLCINLLLAFSLVFHAISPKHSGFSKFAIFICSTEAVGIAHTKPPHSRILALYSGSYIQYIYYDIRSAVFRSNLSGPTTTYTMTQDAASAATVLSFLDLGPTFSASLGSFVLDLRCHRRS